MRRTAATVVVGLLFGTACAGSSAPAPSGPPGPLAPPPGVSRPRLDLAASFHEFAIYWLGRRYDGLPLTGVSRTRVDVPNAAHSRILRTHSHVVDFSYGDCAAGAGEDGGCSPPLEVQDWPACGRNAALYHMPLPLRLHIRGAPAHHFGDRVEIWTGTTDIVIFGKHAARVAEALESVRPGAGPGDRLPPPAPGAIEGRLHCIR